MIINRHNYEGFFLLYVDNELNVAERLAVESFVQQNPDLEEEMEMLKRAVLPAENVLFDVKELLFQHAKGISLDNYLEYFLLAVDKELTEQENDEVEKFVLKHPELQNDYLLLEQTRLEPETITFPSKEKLYRKEGKERRVIFMSWMRISAAASIIGFIAVSWFFVNNGKTSNTVVVTDKIAKPSPEKTKSTAKPFVAEQPVATLHKEVIVAVHSAVKVKEIKPAQSEKEIRANAIAFGFTKSNEDKLLITPVKTLEPQKTSILKKMPSDEVIASTKTVNKNNLPPVHTGVINTTPTNNHTNEADVSIATHAVYREIENREEEQEKSFFIGSAEINKNKLKGLFKKAASFFEKKSNKEDGERTLKIAGFEIKSK